MKKEVEIKIKNLKLRRLRNNLRKIWRKAIYNDIQYLSSFALQYGAFLELSPQEQKEVHSYRKQIELLQDLLRRSICLCEICQKGDKDMAYFPQKKTWYCTECYPRIRELYK